MTQKTIPCYQSSGRFGLSTFLFFALAIGLGIPLAWGYQRLMGMISFLYINLAICIGFGCLLGVLGYGAVIVGHCRSKKLAAVLAIPLFLLPWLSTFYWDYQGVRQEFSIKDNSSQHEQFSEFITNLPDYIHWKEEVGWVLGKRAGQGIKIEGKAVFAVWGAEALVLFVALFALLFGLHEMPYCEVCKRWCWNKKKDSRRGISADSVNALLDERGISGIKNLPMSGSEKDHKLDMTCQYCQSCDQSAFLSIQDRWTYAKNSKGEDQVRTTDVLTQAILSPSEKMEILRLLDKSPTGKQMDP